MARYEFVSAEIIPPGELPGVQVSYRTGVNCSGTGHNEVLQRVVQPDGTEATYVIMRGMSRAKAQAIAMILNAPEE